MNRIKTIILGAAGRDFHNFNTYFRNNEMYEVVAFTATQIPDIADRKYPAELAGSSLYPEGIPIYPEDQIEQLIKRYEIEQAILAYSDLPYQYVMSLASKILANGADFRILGPKHTSIKSKLPVIAVLAVRTGSGKSQTTRRIGKLLRKEGYRVAVIRHPMPYGNLVKQKCQRFAVYDDLIKHECTIEEMEEYEPHIMEGNLVFAGVDFGEILRSAEKEADIVLFDGGNNDWSLYEADLIITVADPHRLGHERSYFPGEVNVRQADVIIINKSDTAPEGHVERLKASIKELNQEATIIVANSPISVDKPELIKNKRVLVVEDGPTLTHGEMKYGAGHIAAKNFEAAEIIDPRPYAKGTIKRTYEKYNHLSEVLPAMGYGEKQRKELEETINSADCDTVIIGTPIDLGRLLDIQKPYTRVTYDLEEVSSPNLEKIVLEFLKNRKK
ncbi:MAG: GTPase [Candidatus Heimdallarchaeota archaeon]|nr:GTPase [Candidatus Heimdallarchaeota archaeon]